MAPGVSGEVAGEGNSRAEVQILHIDSTFWPAYTGLSAVHRLKGQYDQAFDEAHRAGQMGGTNWTEQVNRGVIYASMGRQDDARRCIRQLTHGVGREVVDPGFIAVIYARLGERDSAFAWLDKAYRNHSDWILYVKVYPDFDSLHSDKRYTELLRKVGFSE